VDKPTVYLDTNVFSAFWYAGNNVAATARRFLTRDWWNIERQHFAVYVAVTTINELQAGSFRKQANCLKMVRALPFLAMTRKAKDVLDELLKSGLIPETKPGDALQMAVSTAHRMDYLLTWNYAHLANPVAQGRLEVICRSLDLRAPLLVSPETIPLVRFGQTIRRREH
jgi:hypothetical protein